jgi:hypothetical protein
MRGLMRSATEGKTKMTAATDKTPARRHKATYASDKRSGGYMVRVEGPDANAFGGREVPVTTKDGAEHFERLTKMVWAGIDNESGKNVALYKFESRPREEVLAEF